MSAALDMSLDDVVKQNKTRTNRRVGRGRRVGTKAKAPVGGIQKGTKATKVAPTATQSKATVATGGDSKILVSNLPRDVTETMIKDYFSKAIGPTSRVMLQFDATGNSRGIATIVFKKGGLANDAQTKLNGVKVDDRPMKIEVILDATKPAASKALSERISGSNKSGPKPAASDKPKAATNGKPTRGAGRPRGRGGRGRNRQPRKTADELDAEMVDYFDSPAGGNENAANGTTEQPAAAQGDANMDEISVGS